METTHIKGIGVRASRIALGTWAIGGWMWGGTDEEESISTIHAALDQGITVLDTAPVYFSAARKRSLARLLLDAAAGTGLSSPQRLVWNGRKERSSATPPLPE